MQPSFANDVDDLPAAPKRNGVPLLPVSNPAAHVTLELVNELRDALPWRAFCFGLVDSGAAPPNATARP